MDGRIYGLQLIEARLKEKGATKSQLARKLRISPTTLDKKLKTPTSFYLKEAQAIALLLNFTPEEIYNSFILMYGFPVPKEKKKDG